MKLMEGSRIEQFAQIRHAETDRAVIDEETEVDADVSDVFLLCVLQQIDCHLFHKQTRHQRLFPADVMTPGS